MADLYGGLSALSTPDLYDLENQHHHQQQQHDPSLVQGPPSTSRYPPTSRDSYNTHPNQQSHHNQFDNHHHHQQQHSENSHSRYPVRRSASPGNLHSAARAGSHHSSTYKDYQTQRTSDAYDVHAAGGGGSDLDGIGEEVGGGSGTGGAGGRGAGKKERSSSVVGGTGTVPAGSRKARIANVCDTCRSRKIGCPGGPGNNQPCSRCIKDRRQCVYKGPPPRTSLTRARMTELEGRTTLYAQLWNHLFPTYTMPQLEAEFGYLPRTDSAGSPDEKPASPPDGATMEEAMGKARERAKVAFWLEWGGGRGDGVGAGTVGDGRLGDHADDGLGEGRGYGMDEVERKPSGLSQHRTDGDGPSTRSKPRKVDEDPVSRMTSRRPSFSSNYGAPTGAGNYDPTTAPNSTGAGTNGRNSVERGVLPAPAREFLDEVARGDPGSVRAEDFEWNERRKNDAVVALAGLSSSKRLPYDGHGGSSAFGMFDPVGEMGKFDGQDDAGTTSLVEDEDAADGGKLDGMVSLVKPQQGVSYLGLSSGAIFLGAIRRLCAADPDIPFDALQSQNTQVGQSQSKRPPPFGRSSTTDPHARPGRPGPTRTIDASLLGGSQSATTFGQHGTLWSATGHEAGDTFVLPPQAEIWPLIDSYFSYFHAFTPLVHEPTIKAQVLGAVPIPNRAGSAVLFNMIFAMGAFDAGQFEGADDGTKYYERARQALTEDLLEEGTLQLVQGVAIMANYLQRNNRPNAGYLCLGIATRMATALGLHTTPIKSAYSVLDCEMRKRIWWCLVTLEAGCSVTFGRPCGLSRAAITSMPLPINCNDEHLNVSTTSTPSDVPIPTVYTALIVQARLARLTTGIHDAILQSHPTLNQLKRYDKLLVQLQTDLLPFMQTTVCNGPYHLARSVQVWRIRDFRAILYRPVLLAAAWDAKQQKNLGPAVLEAIGICRDNAVLNLGDIEMYIQSQAECQTPLARGTEWYALFFAFQSCLTLLLSTLWEPGHPAAGSWRMMLSSTASWFRTLRTLNKLGVASAQVLDSIIANAAKTPSITFGQMSPESVRGLDLFNVGGGVPGVVGAGGGMDGGAGGLGGPQIPLEQSAVPLDVWRYWLEIAGQGGPTYDNNMMWDPSLPTDLQYPMQ